MKLSRRFCEQTKKIEPEGRIRMNFLDPVIHMPLRVRGENRRDVISQKH